MLKKVEQDSIVPRWNRRPEIEMSADLDEGCIFCKIARGDFSTPFLVESERVIAFRDIQPQAPTHVLVAPKRHIPNLHSIGAAADLSAELIQTCNAVAKQEGLLESGFRVMTNDGPNAGQSVDHLHFHVLGGRRLGSGWD